MEKAGTRVGIVGLGLSGFESARFLNSRGYQIFVSELDVNARSQAYAQELEQSGMTVELGKHSLEELEKCDWFLLSPGIAPHHLIFKTLLDLRKPVYSEIEAASWFSPTRNIIAITGTSGKTTVTTLVGRVLKTAYGESRVKVCGNIGNPWMSVLAELKEDSFCVLELSSFQLALTQSFHAWIACVLNISPNHLDWHPNMEDYIRSKAMIFNHQTERDHAIAPESFGLDAHKVSSTVHRLGEQTGKDDNERALRLIAELCGVADDVVEKELTSFEGIEHRLEKVGEYNGVMFYNDSKSTTRLSLQWALEKFEDQKVILIAGGKPKASDFDQISGLIKRKVKSAVLIGEAREMLEKCWADQTRLYPVSSLKNAVDQSFELSDEGDVVLFSPACASFDMFENYQARGRAFKELLKGYVSSS